MGIAPPKSGGFLRKSSPSILQARAYIIRKLLILLGWRWKADPKNRPDRPQMELRYPQNCRPVDK